VTEYNQIKNVRYKVSQYNICYKECHTTSIHISKQHKTSQHVLSQLVYQQEY